MIVKNGSQVKYGASNLLISDTRIDMALQKNSDVLFTGYAAKACSVSVYLNRTVISVFGNNIDSWSRINQNYTSFVFTGPSNFTINTQSALPVELTSFVCHVKKTDVFIEWNTATEINSSAYLIERLDNGNNGGWKIIGKVSASGYSNSPKDYSFTDKNLNSGSYQYRLKILDNDGSFNYSEVDKATVGVPEEYLLSQNYPNPFNPATTINYALPSASDVRITVVNAAGEIVSVLTNERQPAGFYNINFNAAKFSSGVYFYTLNAVSTDGKNKIVLTKKAILLK